MAAIPSSERKWVYLDTSFVVDHDSLFAIEWCAFLGVARVTLVVPAMVWGELALLRRRRQLSRPAKDRLTSRLGVIEGELRFKPSDASAETSVRPVVWEYEPEAPPAGVFERYGLDRQVREDRLVAHALHRSRTGTTCIVTRDPGVHRRARALDVDVFDVLDAWFPEGPTENPVGEAHAGGAIELLSPAARNLSLRFATGDTRFAYSFPAPRSNDDQEIEKHTEYYRQLYRHWSDRSAADKRNDDLRYLYHAPSRAGIAAYDAAIDRFHEEVARALPALLEAHNLRDRFVEMRLEVWNGGPLAENVVVVLVAPSGFAFAARLPDEHPRPAPPELPAPEPRPSIEAVAEIGGTNPQWPPATKRPTSPRERGSRWAIDESGAQVRAEIAAASLPAGQSGMLPEIYVVLPPWDRATNFGISYEIQCDNAAGGAGRLDIVVSKADRPRDFVYFPWPGA